MTCLKVWTVLKFSKNGRTPEVFLTADPTAVATSDPRKVAEALGFELHPELGDNLELHGPFPVIKAAKMAAPTSVVLCLRSGRGVDSTECPRAAVLRAYAQSLLDSEEELWEARYGIFVQVRSGTTVLGDYAARLKKLEV